MSYPTLSMDEAERLYVAFRDDQLDDDDLADVTRYVEGPAIDTSRIESLAHILWEIVDGLEQGRNSGLEFERIVAPELHEHLSLSQVPAADAGFWRWLTFSSGGDLAALIKWRYGRNDKSMPKKYFGMGNVKESMYGYLWLRANAVYDPSRPDPYELCRRGDVDLWQSHIVRVDFGSVPAMARAFVDFVHPEPEVQRLDREEYRALARELARRNSSMLFEMFDDEAAAEFISNIWKHRDSWMKVDGR